MKFYLVFHLNFTFLLTSSAIRLQNVQNARVLLITLIVQHPLVNSAHLVVKLVQINQHVLNAILHMS